VYLHRTYRNFCENQRLIPFQVTIKETDLYIKAHTRLENETRELIATFRSQVEDYIQFHPSFKKSLTPLPFDESAPPIVKEMLNASSPVGVGPMASVAGAIAEFVGKSLLKYSPEVIVENGGDIFAQISQNIVVEIFAGKSPLSQKIGLKIPPSDMPLGICTSSGTVGPSLSFGKADSVTVLSSSTSLADAFSTSIGNTINKESDIKRGFNKVKSIPQIKGVVIILGEKIAVWGNTELIKL